MNLVLLIDYRGYKCIFMRYVIFDLNAYPDLGYKSIKSVLIGLLLDVILVLSTLKILPLTLVLIKTIGKKSGAF